jgi:hypothetical protein
MKRIGARKLGLIWLALGLCAAIGSAQVATARVQAVPPAGLSAARTTEGQKAATAGQVSLENPESNTPVGR